MATTKNITGVNAIFRPTRRRFENLWTDFEPYAESILPRGWKKSFGHLTLREAIIWTKDVPITLRDGVVIRCDVFRPADRAGEALPTSNYNFIGVPKHELSGLEKFDGPDPAEWCPRGYAIVQPDARGTFNSEGDVYHYGTQEAQDGYDTVEWIAEQPWSNGNVALVGNSHLGTMQWFIAGEQPPHLKAIAPWEGVGDFYRQSICRGGIPNTGFWSALSESHQGENLREDIGAMAEKYPHMNAYWADKVPKIQNIKIPMYVLLSYSTGLHTEGSFRGWKYSNSVDKWLRIHPTQEWHDIYQPESTDDLQRFFDRYLLGKQNGWEETPKVLVSLLRFNRPPIVHLPEDNYPPSRTSFQTLYLDASDGALSLKPVEREGAASFQSDRFEDDGAHFWYTFTQYTELLGPSKAKLFMSCQDLNDMDVYVQIRKVSVDGRPLTSVNVPFKDLPHTVREEDIEDLCLYKHLGPSGRLRASKRATGQDPALSEEQKKSQLPTEIWFPYDQEAKVTPGDIVELDIAIWPTGIAFERGETLRIGIKGHDHHLHEIEHLGPKLKNLNKGQHFVHCGGRYPSQVLLPFVYY
ncbi:hypothetical protein N8T08_009665 [Aspergillus melleus]|uniref:Uncharacterized protein n=1 Tax=Aspergillus melleus TaxID=138277 RepID=A0ACC3ATJ7_9EURO|nr:hypothetical protein N8T08_009665 [Aspergillus melleus]